MSPKSTAINEALRRSAAAAAKARSEAAAKKIRDAMVLIDQEIEANEGIYPGGKLNQREVCRRANIHYQTLQQPAQKDSLKRDVDAWLDEKKTKTIRDTRKAFTERAEHWKEQHKKVATQICIYEAELAEKDSRIAELEELLTNLQEQTSRLKKANVKPLSSIPKEKQ